MNAGGLFPIETQSRYSHIIEDARLSPKKPTADAPYEARAELVAARWCVLCVSRRRADHV